MRTFDEVAKLVRPEIMELKGYTCARDKVKEGILLDANENPFPRSRGETLVNRYPDPHQDELRKALGRFAGAPASCLLAGSGSDEVFDWLFKVFCTPGKDSVAIFEPTYGMYEVMAGIFGVTVIRFQLDHDFAFKAECFLEKAGEDIKILFLCSPNNPTGNLMDEAEIVKVLKEWDGIVVVDEAYLEFSGKPSLASLVQQYPNLVVTRTMSKAFGSAGIRLGYVLADPGIIQLFLKVKLPYNLNALTQRTGIDLLEHIQEAVEEIELIISERVRMRKELEAMEGIEIVSDSQANFLLFRCREAPAVYEKLFRKGIVIRDRGTQYGLHNCLRVSVGTPEENDLFLTELGRILGKPFQTAREFTVPASKP